MSELGIGETDHFTAGVDGWGRLGDTVAQMIAAAGRHVPDQAATTTTPERLGQLVELIDPCPTVGSPNDEIASWIAERFVADTVNVASSWTVAHLHCPTLTASAATETLIGALNQSMDTYDQSPAATMLEDRVVRWLGGEFGLPESCSGVFTAGGTASNILAMTLVRERHARRGGHHAMADGVPASARSWRILASDQAHFSIAQAAAVLGLGRAAVIPVASDDVGAMRLDALDLALSRCREHGHEVMAVVGTAGTTDAGAIDPLPGIAERAREAGVWFHVDAAVGSGLVLSERLRPLLDGTEHADSITTDFHKLWWQPIGASALLVRDGASFDTIRQQSEYLDRDEDVAAGVLNLVGRSLDTTRRSDVLKLVVGLRSVGRAGMAAMLEHVVDLTGAVAAHIDAVDGMELLRPSSTVMVLFRVSRDGWNDHQIDALNVAVQRRLFAEGTAVLGRTRVGGRVALKLTLINPLATMQTTTDLLDVVVAAADALSSEVAAGVEMTP